MASLAGFLDRLVSEGRVVFRDAPRAKPSADDRTEAVTRLRQAFDDMLIELAGPPLAFDERSALAAAEWTRTACWFLVNRGEPAEVVEHALRLPPPPRSAGEHLSADLTFRYLAAVHRRARAIDPGDVLSRTLAEAIRRWPLSGVLSDVEDGPTSPIDFDGHEGLLLLFAERLAAHPKPRWTPSVTPGRDWLGLALDAIGPPRTYFMENGAQGHDSTSPPNPTARERPGIDPER
ncbi:hypothetical protein [Tautonia rosea]|uniref:hypothetical protein n=1 Tax=Tautonia rosea TaxID=2728037 RepID=UPI001474EFCE|nr:hypothetical protein [Tautonia rosea]